MNKILCKSAKLPWCCCQIRCLGIKSKNINGLNFLSIYYRNLLGIRVVTVRAEVGETQLIF